MDELELTLALEEIAERRGRSLKQDQLNAALRAAHPKMYVIEDSKGQRNNTFASIEAMIEATQPILDECGLTVDQVYSWINAVLVLDTILTHDSGQWRRSRINLPESPGTDANTKAQGTGCFTTYFRRYSYAAILGLKIGDQDLDTQPLTEIHRTSYITDEQYATLVGLFEKYAGSEQKLRTKLNYNYDFRRMFASKYKETLDALRDIVKQ